MARKTLSAVLAGGLLLFAGVQAAPAGIFSFFHGCDCCCRDCCRQCERECEEPEPEREHCCCLRPPCPPEGIFVFSMPFELNTLQPLAQPQQKEQPKEQPKAPAAPEVPCTLEELCKRQRSMETELSKLDKELTELTKSVETLAVAVKGKKNGKPAAPATPAPPVPNGAPKK